MDMPSARRILHHPAVIGITIYLAEVLTRTDNSLAAALLVITAMLASRSIICLRRLYMSGTRNRDVLTWDTETSTCGKPVISGYNRRVSLFAGLQPPHECDFTVGDES